MIVHDDGDVRIDRLERLLRGLADAVDRARAIHDNRGGRLATARFGGCVGIGVRRPAAREGQARQGQTGQCQFSRLQQHRDLIPSSGRPQPVRMITFTSEDIAQSVTSGASRFRVTRAISSRQPGSRSFPSILTARRPSFHSVITSMVLVRDEDSMKKPCCRLRWEKTDPGVKLNRHAAPSIGPGRSSSPFRESFHDPDQRPHRLTRRNSVRIHSRHLARAVRTSTRFPRRFACV